MATERRANPGDDLMTKLVTVKDERGPLTDQSGDNQHNSGQQRISAGLPTGHHGWKL